jgi:hypothetical protein
LEDIMGMFDSLLVECTCGRTVEFQSKAGDCALHRFSLSDCAPAVAGSLIGESRACECGRKVKLYGHVMLAAEISGATVIERAAGSETSTAGTLREITEIEYVSSGGSTQRYPIGKVHPRLLEWLEIGRPWPSSMIRTLADNAVISPDQSEITFGALNEGTLGRDGFFQTVDEADCDSDFYFITNEGKRWVPVRRWNR